MGYTLALSFFGLLVQATSSAAQDAPPPVAKPNLALHVGKIITCAGKPIINGTILVSNGKIEALGPRAQIKVPTGYTEIDHGDKFAMPGLVDVHSHVGGSGDINEMVYQTNPELRVLDVIRPHNDQLKVAAAGGVTTICFIPGSGTNMGGWGALMACLRWLERLRRSAAVSRCYPAHAKSAATG